MTRTKRPSFLGTKIASLRARSGLSVRALASNCGVSHGLINGLELGAQQTTSAHNLVSIAKALDVPPLSLLDEPSSESPMAPGACKSDRATLSIQSDAAE